MTADRRTTPDRRTRPGGRRQTDAEPDHGTRARYQAGCACTPCKAAEAAYRSDLRKKHLKGLPILGLLVSPVEARRRLRQLKLEEYPVARVERMGGWGPRTLQLDRQQLIRLSTLIRMRRVAAFAMLAGADGVGDAPAPPA